MIYVIWGVYENDSMFWMMLVKFLYFIRNLLVIFFDLFQCFWCYFRQIFVYLFVSYKTFVIRWLNFLGVIVYDISKKKIICFAIDFKFNFYVNQSYIYSCLGFFNDFKDSDSCFIYYIQFMFVNFFFICSEFCFYVFFICLKWIVLSVIFKKYF